MPRQADLLFLKLAVKNRLIDEATARAVVLELERRASAGKPTKARLLLVERGLVDKETSRELKHLVRHYLQGKSESSLERKAIASYEVEERLGQGAMGVVYRARHVNLDKVVALKILQPECASDECYVKRFILEARAAAALDHPNLVQAYDVGEEDGIFYLAMEYVEGENVKQIVERDGKLDEKRALEVAIQVAAALAHAHEHSIIHRDVKPSNIMLTRDGTAKLLDLGLARRVEKDEDPSLTSEGKAIGTPYYMSPEQGLDAPIDHRADIYALGATIFYMVTGEVPFRGPTPHAVIAKHLHEKAPDPRSRVKELSSGLSRAVLAMLEKDPRDRPQDCGAVKRDLEGVLAGLSVGKPLKRSRSKTKTTATHEAAEPKKKKTATVPVLVTTLAAAAAGILVVALSARTTHGSSPTVATAPVQRPIETQVEATVDAPRAAPRVEEAGPDQARAARENLERRARAARELEERTSAEEEKKVDEAWTAFEVALDGEKLAKVADLAEHARSEKARERARACLADGESRLERRADKLEVDAAQLASSEREDEAAKLLRQAAGLRKDTAKRAELARRADELDRSREARVAQARETKRESERARYAALCGTVRERVRARDLEKGAREAAAVGDALEDQELKEKAATHALALASLLALDKVALKSFEARKGDRVELSLRQGQPVSGTILSVADGRVVVRVSAGVERAIAIADLDDRTIAREVRRSNANDPNVALALAVAALYRGEGTSALAKLDETSRARLGAIASDVAPEPTVAAKPEGDAAPVSDKPRATPRPSKPTPEPAVKDEKKDDKKDDIDLTKLVYERRSKVFPDADQVGWSGARPIAWYDFLAVQRELVGRDWQTLEGRPYRAPRGSAERAGLVLDGANGRASFQVPLQGTVRVKVVFTSQMSLRRESLFGLSFEDPKTGTRIEANLGHLSEPARGKRQAREGTGDADASLRLSVRDQHTLEVTIEDGVAVAKLDGRETSRLESVQLGDRIQLSLEWSRIAANLHGVEVEALPEREYALKALGIAPPPGAGHARVSPAK